MLLEVEDLSVTFDTPDGEVRAVQNVSFELDRGQTLGIVGESGSGKSVSTQAIVGLLKGADISGSSRFDGQDLLTMSSSKLQQIRGSDIGMIFQDPLTSLHPYYRVGWQIMEQIRAHEDVSKKAAHSRPPTCSGWSVSRSPIAGSTTSRTSSPAVCVSVP